MKNNKKNINEDLLLINDNTSDSYKEAFQTAITNIEFATIDQKEKVIAITSSSQSEGKTTFISNLALSYVFDNKKVLLLDCDNRRPNVHKVFGLENKEGLSNAILDDRDYKDYIQKCNGVDIVTAGVKSPFPASLFNSHYFEKLINQVKQDYDVVLIDTPPVLAVSDVLIISKNITGILFLVASNESKKSELIEAMHQFKEKQINVIGTVVTRSKQGKDKYYLYE